MLVVGALVIILPLSLLAAAVLMIPARHFRLIPNGVSAWVAHWMLALLMTGGFLFAASVEAMLIRPIQLHQQYLGRSYASPLRLSYFEEGGFQDPYEIWHHSLTQADAAELRKRCKPREPGPWSKPDVCSLFGDMDERWYIYISLDGDVLVVNEGLH
jgi:hypothetical protein